MAKLKALGLTAALKVVYLNYLNLTAIIALPLDSRCQFHQHFTRAFFVRKQIVQLSLVMLQHVVFGAKISYKKCERNMLMKLTLAIYQGVPLLWQKAMLLFSTIAI